MTILPAFRQRALLPLGLLAIGAASSLAACGGDEATAADTSTTGFGGTGGTPNGGSAGTQAQAGAAGKAQGGTSSTGGAGGMGQGGSTQAGGASGQAQTAGTGGTSATGGFGGTSVIGGNGGAGADQGGSGQAGSDAAGTGGTGVAGTGSTGTAGSGPIGTGGKGGGTPGTPKSEVEMTFTTANVGRDYNTKANVQAAFDKIGDVLDPKDGPRFIGWQEIGEGDPCGDTCEIEALENRFKESAGWSTRRPKGKRPDNGMETVKVPVTSKGAEGQAPDVRAVFASPGWAGVSPTRFVTVVYYPERNLSLVNTHFIAGAWSCGSDVAQRKEYWQKDWATLKAEVAEEHQKGRNVVVTGDLNRARAKSNCNPDWEPGNVHPDARDIGGTGIDYIFAVPANPNKFVLAKKADGSPKEGEIAIAIDSHKAHWVSGAFVSK